MIGVGKVAYLDIETSNIGGNFEIVYCWAIKPGGRRSVLAAVINERSFRAEKRILTLLLEELSNYSTIVTYFGSHFDLPHLRTRCLFHGLDFPENARLRHIDLYGIVRKTLQIRSNRLRHVAKLLGIEGKAPFRREIWVAASRGDQHALRYMVRHNEWDVRILEQVHRAILAFSEFGTRGTEM